MPRLVYRDPYVKVPQVQTHLPPEVKPYEYKTRRTARIEPMFDQPDRPPEEMLTGYVHGERASDLEERFAMALDFYGLTYQFQYEVASMYTLPDQEKKIDFIVFDGGIAWPVEIGSKFVHGTPSKQEEEQERMNQMNIVLPMLGIQQLNDESYLPLDRPKDFEDAKYFVSKMFISV